MKIFLGIVAAFFTIFGNDVWAQNIEFETIRTVETPGFFLVKIFPASQNEPLKFSLINILNIQMKLLTCL